MYFLEKKIDIVKDTGYTYSRRAQATLHTWKWKQVAVSEDLQALKNYSENLAGEYRIINNDLEGVQND